MTNRTINLLSLALFFLLWAGIHSRATQLIIPPRSINLFEEALETGHSGLNREVFGKILKQVLQDGTVRKKK